MKETLLALLRDAMYGTAPGEVTLELVEACPQPDMLLNLAEIHNILPLVGPLFLQAKQDYAEKEKLRQYIRTHVVRQIMATDALCRIAQALDKNNIPYLVVKGAACRALYPAPDQRPSTDEDILVAPENLEKATEVLLSMGYSKGTAEQEEQVHHFVGPFLHVELHQALTGRKSLENIFQSKLDTPQSFVVNGLKLRTLPPPEHFLFLVEHFYKHFIHGGVGIRQVADMVLMARQPGICWKEIWAKLEEMGLAVLVCGVLEIGMEYLGLSADFAEIPAEIRKRSPGWEPLLQDILDAGVFGGSSMERRHSSSVTVQAVQGEREIVSLQKTLFPARKSLVGRYPYLQQRPWLLPVAWCSRIVGYLQEDKSAGKRAAESISLGKQRIGLMKQYEILK